MSWIRTINIPSVLRRNQTSEERWLLGISKLRSDFVELFQKGVVYGAPLSPRSKNIMLGHFDKMYEQYESVCKPKNQGE